MSLAGDAVHGFVDGILQSPLLTRLADLIPDPVEKAKRMAELQEQLLDYAQKSDLAQMAVNQEEAKNENLFVSGWRPFVGWVCGAAFAYQFLVQPFAIFAITASGIHFDFHVLPKLDWSDMMPVMIGMLGLGGMRTAEKFKGVN
jgi:hypothetical protein